MAGWKRYTFRVRDAKTADFLSSLPNHSDFIRRAIENEIAGRGCASGADDGEVVRRLAGVERVQQMLASDIQRVLAELQALGRRELYSAASAGAGEQGAGAPGENGRPPEEDLNMALGDIMSFGQRGGERP